MTQDIEQGSGAEELPVPRIPRAVWINRPGPAVNGARATRGAVGALVAAGIFTMAIASPAAIAPAPQTLLGTDAELLFAITPVETIMLVPATPRTAAAYLPAQIAPAALHSPEEQSPTF